MARPEPGDQGEAGGDGREDFTEGSLAGDDVGEIESRLDVAEDVGVGEAQVRVQKDDAPSHAGEHGGKVDGERFSRRHLYRR